MENGLLAVQSIYTREPIFLFEYLKYLGKNKNPGPPVTFTKKAAKEV